MAVLANSSLDDTTVGAFLSFVNDELTELISPEEILDASSFAPIKKRIAKLAKSTTGGHRIDRLSAICTRIFLHITIDNYKPGKTHKHNLVSFLSDDLIPQSPANGDGDGYPETRR